VVTVSSKIHQNVTTLNGQLEEMCNGSFLGWEGISCDHGRWMDNVQWKALVSDTEAGFCY